MGSSRIPRLSGRCSRLPQTPDFLEDLHTPRNPRFPWGCSIPPHPDSLEAFYNHGTPAYQEVSILLGNPASLRGVPYPYRPSLPRGCFIPSPRPPILRGCSIPHPDSLGPFNTPRNPRFIGGSPYSHGTPSSRGEGVLYPLDPRFPGFVSYIAYSTLPKIVKTANLATILRKYIAAHINKSRLPDYL